MKNTASGTKKNNIQQFSYVWKLSELSEPTKKSPVVFSCFAGGGGSSMGYKLAGFNVLGGLEIDKKMAECYITNLKPKYFFITDIKNMLFNKIKIPKDLYNLDILDGSPPCTLFSLSNIHRKNKLGKAEKYKEGNTVQILDELFFDFIALAVKLKPKIVVAENVPELLNCESHLKRIVSAFDKSNYQVIIQIIQGEKIGLPQKRHRLIFTGIRKDIFKKNKIKSTGIFYKIPKLNFYTQKTKVIPFQEVSDLTEKIIEKNEKLRLFSHSQQKKPTKYIQQNYELLQHGRSFGRIHPKGSFFNYTKLHPYKPAPTLTTQIKGLMHFKECRVLSVIEYMLCSSFPLDYNFLTYPPHYIMGMSVPPLMIKKIADCINNQWLKKN